MIDAMETTSKVKTEGKAGFAAIPDLDKMAVGHAGLYVPAADDIDVADAKVVSADITLGLKGGKTLIDCEKGIKAFVKELAADKSNHLPNKETGVWVYYLTQGIMRDFNRTWESTPVSLQGNRGGVSKIEKDRERGKRGLSKNEKNELLAKLTYQYYEEDVNTGKISQADAFALMAQAAAKKKELEDAGYFLSPKKTEGVSLFDWKASIIDAHGGSEDAIKIYRKNKVEVLIPDVIENYFSKSSNALRLAKEMYKSPVAATTGVWDVIHGNNTDMELSTIKSGADLCKFLNNNSSFATVFNNIESEYNIKSFHLTKIKMSGKMKPRQICIDCVSKKDGKQHLFLLENGGGVYHFQ